jgi:tRNA-dihydrouridine synthase
MDREVIYKDAKTVIEKIVDKEIELEIRHYPLVGYGNNHGTRIIVGDDAVKVYEFANGWAVRGSMTGTWEIAHIEDKEFADKIRQEIEKVKTPDDFNKLIELINEQQDKISNEVNELFKEVVDELEALAQEYSYREELKELLNDKQKLREFLSDCLDSYLADA